MTKDEKRRLDNLGIRIDRALSNLSITPLNIKLLRKYYELLAEEYRFRHKVIRRTIRYAQKPLVGEYGSFHSILVPELLRRGHSVSIHSRK